ncbi:putative beta-glucosidase C [Sarocladium implicatum]|nr:putative beta-glucosidase C [Sarocladium implicatum]
MVAESLLNASYWDASLPVEQRVADLLSHMTLEEKVGQMFHWMAMLGTDESFTEPNPMMGLEPIHHSITNRLISHYGLVGSITDVRAAVKWHNGIQRLARDSTRLGIPITVSSDPRHHFHNNVGTSSEAGALSQWPETLGLAALRNPAVTKRFAEIAATEYRALGIRCALHPQIDLATEYRWSRINGTFGEDADLTSELVQAYIEGFQGGSKLKSNSVSCMIKHFPGGGPLRDGEDSHFSYGKIQQYPGGQFDYHLKPFVAALEAGAAQVMPAYGIPTGLDGCEEVAFGFNKHIITNLLREKLGFNGVVVTDWGLVTDHNIMGQPCEARAWGVEHLSRIELVAKILEAGCDQLGGEKCVELILELVKSGRLQEARIDESVARILRDKFLLGLFDNAFVDEEEAVKVVGQASFRAAAAESRTGSITLLESQAGALPLRPASERKSKVYAMNVSAEALVANGCELVDNVKDADVAILRLQAPFETRSGNFEAMFHMGSLDFSEDTQRQVLDICQAVPTIVDVYLDRPAVLTPFAGAKASALLASYGSSDDDLLKVIFGKAEPLGKLPFDLPRSMSAVDGSRTDVAFDTEDALFKFGHGLG